MVVNTPPVIDTTPMYPFGTTASALTSPSLRPPMLGMNNGTSRANDARAPARVSVTTMRRCPSKMP